VIVGHLPRVFSIQKRPVLHLPGLRIRFIPEKLEAAFLDFIQQLFVGSLKWRAARILRRCARTRSTTQTAQAQVPSRTAPAISVG